MKSILLVEDDPFLVDIYTAKFLQAGFEIKAVKDGQEAWRFLEDSKETPSLLLLDIVLPGLEGWELLRKIRENSRFSALKVVILSNLGQKEEVKKGLKLGADKYLIKAHYTPSEVVEEVKRLI